MRNKAFREREGKILYVIPRNNDNQLILDISGSQKNSMFKALRRNYFKLILLQFSINLGIKYIYRSLRI